MWQTDVITELTSEQESLISVYQEKWRAIALSTEPIDRQKAAEAIESVYTAIGERKPKILFSDSPYAALKNFVVNPRRWQWQLPNPLMTQLGKQLNRQLAPQLRDQLSSQLWGQLYSELSWLVYPLREQLRSHLKILIDDCIEPMLWACSASWFDFCISVLNCQYDQGKWQAFESLVRNCGLIFLLENYEDQLEKIEKTCLVCDRPIKVSFDDNQPLPVAVEPVIQFADGYSLYVERDVALPKTLENYTSPSDLPSSGYILFANSNRLPKKITSSPKTGTSNGSLPGTKRGAKN